VTVRATTRDGFVAFVVEDDGRGFNVASVALSHEGGFGLQAMRERMELIGGSLAIDSAPGQGTRITALVPAVSNAALVGDGAAAGAGAAVAEEARVAAV
jgi:signal transduction histidine kinase